MNNSIDIYIYIYHPLDLDFFFFLGHFSTRGAQHIPTFHFGSNMQPKCMHSDSIWPSQTCVLLNCQLKQLPWQVGSQQRGLLSDRCFQRTPPWMLTWNSVFPSDQSEGMCYELHRSDSGMKGAPSGQPRRWFWMRSHIENVRQNQHQCMELLRALKLKSLDWDFQSVFNDVDSCLPF